MKTAKQTEESCDEKHDKKNSEKVTSLGSGI